MYQDEHLGQAVDASRAWYQDIHALHGVSTVVRRGVWQSQGPPPPWHSGVMTLDRNVPVSEVLAAVVDRPSVGVADSFASLDLAEHGFTLLFEAHWLRLDTGRAPAASVVPDHWSRVTSSGQLATWSDLHDYAGVLTDALNHPRFEILARHRGPEMIAGAVLHDAGDSIGLSNIWSLEDVAGDIASVLAIARTAHPGRPVTTYARGEELDILVGNGFQVLGPHRVWARQPTV
ncbi:MAG TPA: hypothetical protein VGV65_07240 [Nocardioides sp.]|nr:hypothetical protein [Nocardioides sp.]